MGFFNLELKRQMAKAERDFATLHDAIFELEEPKILDGLEELSPAQRSALEAFQTEAIQRVNVARRQAIKAQQLSIKFHSTSGPYLYRKARSNRADNEWESRIGSLNVLKGIFGTIMGPYE